jgi:hypothetical protein
VCVRVCACACVWVGVGGCICVCVCVSLWPVPYQISTPVGIHNNCKLNQQKVRTIDMKIKTIALNEQKLEQIT